MILVDTSVWIDHFRSGSSALRKLLDAAQVLAHPFVVGELACGNLRNRARILADLRALPCAVVPDHREVLRLVDDRRLWSKGLGWIDCHLLASAMLSHCRLWTKDRALRRLSSELGVEYRTLIVSTH